LKKKFKKLKALLSKEIKNIKMKIKMKGKQPFSKIHIGFIA
jgi:hypothetical protein